MFPIRSHYSLVLCDVTFPIQSIHQKKSCNPKVQPPHHFCWKVSFYSSFSVCSCIGCSKNMAPQIQGIILSSKTLPFCTSMSHFPTNSYPQIAIVVDFIRILPRSLDLFDGCSTSPQTSYGVFPSVLPTSQFCPEMLKSYRLFEGFPCNFFSPHSYPLSENGTNHDKSPNIIKYPQITIFTGKMMMHDQILEVLYFQTNPEETQPATLGMTFGLRCRLARCFAFLTSLCWGHRWVQALLDLLGCDECDGMKDQKKVGGRWWMCFSFAIIKRHNLKICIQDSYS